MSASHAHMATPHVIKAVKVAEKKSSSWASWDAVSSFGKQTVDLLYSTPTNTIPKDSILVTKFQKILIDGVLIPALLVGYNNGFQVWDLQNASRGGDVVELVSKSWGKVGIITAVYKPVLDKNGDPTSTKQTFLVIVSAEEASQAYSNTTISFYNVATDAVETRMEFDAPVTDVQCNDRFIVAGTKTGIIHVLEINTLKLQRSIMTFPHPEYGAVFSVGARWLAYQALAESDIVNGNYTLDVDTDDAPTGSTSPNMASASLWNSAKSSKLAEMTTQSLKTMIYYGNKTIERLSEATVTPPSSPHGSGNFGSSGVHRSKQPARTDGKLAGVVQVTDLVGSSTLAYFKADSDPLTALSFDPTGSLLLSCQGSGQEMTLWRISPRAKPSHRKLYVLQRGMSINQVRDIFWADDSSLVAFTSRANGTTHVFPIRQCGGEPDVSTHLQKPTWFTFSDSSVVKPSKLVTIHSDKTANKSQFAGNSAFISGTLYDKKSGTACIALANMKLDGTLVKYDIEMRPSETTRGHLHGDAIPKARWDLCRTTKNWEEVSHRSRARPRASSQPDKSHQSEDEQSLVYLANAEMETCHTKGADKPFWQVPMFHLVVYTESVDIPHDISNPRVRHQANDDQYSEKHRKAHLLLQNDAVYRDTPTRPLTQVKKEQIEEPMQEAIADSFEERLEARRKRHAQPPVLQPIVVPIIALNPPAGEKPAAKRDPVPEPEPEPAHEEPEEPEQEEPEQEEPQAPEPEEKLEAPEPDPWLQVARGKRNKGKNNQKQQEPEPVVVPEIQLNPPRNNAAPDVHVNPNQNNNDDKLEENQQGGGKRRKRSKSKNQQQQAAQGDGDMSQSTLLRDALN